VREAAGGRLATGIALAYPLGDIVTLTILLFAVMRAPRRDVRQVPLRLLGFGLAGLAVSDTGFVYLTSQAQYSSGSLIDLGWFAGFALIYAAARCAAHVESSGHDDRVPPLSSVAVPYIPVVGAAVTVVGLRLSGRALDSVTVITAMAALVLCAVRHLLTQMENVSLLRTLAERVERRTAELQRGEERFRSLVQNSSDVVTIVGSDSSISYQSPSIRGVFGHDPDALLGTYAVDLIASGDRARFMELLRATVAGPACGTGVLELGIVDSSGAVRATEITVTNLLHDPSVEGLVLNGRDITDQKRLEVELMHQAFHDSLTGLANRALFKERVGSALLRRERQRRGLAVLFLDLDRFKGVNDSFGHASGDVLLQAVSRRLLNCVRISDTVARLGGDEFGILVENVMAEAEIQVVADRVREAFRDPVVVEGREVVIPASIGIAFSESLTDTADDLLRNADLAMYRAKGAGGATCRRYVPDMHAGLVDRLELEADLRHAIDRGELHLEYQPIVDIAGGAVRGAEALLRWRHPKRGNVPPNTFIPVAEASGLIVPIGEWVLQEACREARRWDQFLPGGDTLSVSVNVSGRQLQGTDFAAIVPHALIHAGLPASRLVLEITESTLVDRNDDVMAVLHELRDMGVRIAIDDFGTGFSSLSRLHSFPVDVLKIDRSFIDRLSGDRSGASLAASIVRLGQGLNMATVAEGIEDEVQLAALQELGCDLGQGYLFARPLSSPDFQALIICAQSAADQAGPP
jgi:diguanylate cyclase (GGDEF)-like protein/PAS domain S-box-containing protein